MRDVRSWVAGTTATLVAAGSVLALVAPATAAGKIGIAKLAVRGSDFNGDGFNDLAVGAPGTNVAGLAFAGAVTVAFGSRAGLNPASRVVLTQATANVPGEPVASARFGESVAVGDFNGDRFADLAVGTPNDGDNGSTLQGSITVFFGSSAGLTRPARITGTYHLGTALTAADVNGDGRPEILSTETPSNFGHLYRFTVPKNGYTVTQTADSGNTGLSILTSGDITGDGYEDVVAFYNSVGGSRSFTVYLGSRAGLTTEERHFYTHEGGADAALGDLNRDGRADLVIGRPVNTFDTPLGGEVTVWYGTSRGLQAEASGSITQDTPGIPDTAEEYDQFGSAVAIGDITGDGNPELVIGAQEEGVGDVAHAGAVTILRGSPRGITVNGWWVTKSATGVPGTPTAYDRLGWLASVRDFNADRRADLVVTAIGGNPTEQYPYYGDGSVAVLPGTAAGVTRQGAVVLTGGAQARFGWSLAR